MSCLVDDRMTIYVSSSYRFIPDYFLCGRLPKSTHNIGIIAASLSWPAAFRLRPAAVATGAPRILSRALGQVKVSASDCLVYSGYTTLRHDGVGERKGVRDYNVPHFET